MNVLICGASARAAAFSAIRAGLQSITFDLFADRDLTSLCPAHRVPAELYPSALADLTQSVPPCAWFYTGGLENHPDLVDEISQRHSLLGNSGAILRAVRDPIRVAAVVEEAGLPAPRVCLDPSGLAADGSWLAKPLASGGGLGITVWDGVLRPGLYYQRRIEGLSLSAVFVGDQNGVEFVGITRQLIARPGAPFAYVGSIGPWPLLPVERERVEMLGSVVASAFGLVGFFGVDFILKDEYPWAVEINPRYTASVEVLELAQGRALLKDHLRVCRSHCLAAGDESNGTQSVGTRGGGIIGKMILFAEGPCGFPAIEEADLEMIADVPHEGTQFEPGDPIMTVFAMGETVSECESRLAHRQRAWTERLRAT